MQCWNQDSICRPSNSTQHFTLSIPGASWANCQGGHRIHRWTTRWTLQCVGLPWFTTQYSQSPHGTEMTYFLMLVLWQKAILDIYFLLLLPLSIQLQFEDWLSDSLEEALLKKRHPTPAVCSVIKRYKFVSVCFIDIVVTVVLWRRGPGKPL